MKEIDEKQIERDQRRRCGEQKWSEVIENIQKVCEDICDNYCKYRDTVDEDGICDGMRNGRTCPMDRLF